MILVGFFALFLFGLVVRYDTLILSILFDSCPIFLLDLHFCIIGLLTGRFRSLLRHVAVVVVVVVVVVVGVVFGPAD